MVGARPWVGCLRVEGHAPVLDLGSAPDAEGRGPELVNFFALVFSRVREFREFMVHIGIKCNFLWSKQMVLLG